MNLAIHVPGVLGTIVGVEGEVVLRPDRNGLLHFISWTSKVGLTGSGNCDKRQKMIPVYLNTISCFSLVTLLTLS